MSAHVHNVQNFFHRAFHTSLSKTEQEAALAKLRKVFTEIDVMDIEIVQRKATNQITHRTTTCSTIDTGSLDSAVAQSIRTINDTVKRVERLREENDTIRAQNRAQAERIAELEARIAELEAAQAAPAAVSDTGEEYVLWAEFEAAAIKAFGREGSWKSVFAFEADMDVRTLTAWQTVGIIPARYVTLARTLTADQKAMSSRKKWTDDEYDRLEALVAEGHRDREIANILSRELGRRLIETSITGARRRLFRTR